MTHQGAIDAELKHIQKKASHRKASFGTNNVLQITGDSMYPTFCRDNLFMWDSKREEHAALSIILRFIMATIRKAGK